MLSPPEKIFLKMTINSKNKFSMYALIFYMHVASFMEN
jgi:hypothetical protein